MSPEIVSQPTFSLHVFAQYGAQTPARCHVRRTTGGAETVVSLPFLTVLAGPQPSEREWDALLDSLQLILDTWADLNDDL